MVVFAILFSLFQCLVMAILLVLAVSNDGPNPWLSNPVIWLGILFGPAIYLFAGNKFRRPVINLAVAVLFVMAVVLGFTPGRFALFPYYHQILLMGAMVSGLAIGGLQFPMARPIDNQASCSTWHPGVGAGSQRHDLAYATQWPDRHV
jgi:hypothetical protein